MSSLLPIERAVLEKLLFGPGAVLSILREQIDQISVSEREFTGVGFFAKFAEPIDVLRIDDFRSTKIGDVYAEISSLKHGAGFLLYIENGILHMLEGFTYDEPWPAGPYTFELTYIHPQRNLGRLEV
jgi:hypothetical protein